MITPTQVLTDVEDRLQDAFVSLQHVHGEIAEVARVPASQLEDLAAIGRLVQLAHAKLQDFNADRHQEQQDAQRWRSQRQVVPV